MSLPQWQRHPLSLCCLLIIYVTTLYIIYDTTILWHIGFYAKIYTVISLIQAASGCRVSQLSSADDRPTNVATES